jgi:hypothetical protein
MSIIDSTIRTIKCDSEGCAHEVTFDRKDEKAIFEDPNNSWLKSTRIIQTADGRNLVACSDGCTVALDATGKLNLPEAPKVVAAANPAQVEAAAKLAAARQQAEQALRTGQPANIQITD